MTELERLASRAGLAVTDAAIRCLTEADARTLNAMTGPGVSALALRALIYTFLVESPPESALGQIARAIRETRPT